VTLREGFESGCVRSGSVRAACDSCGEWPGVLHFARESHGRYCAACCPVCTEAADLARMYFGAAQIEFAERLGKQQAEGDFREQLHLAAFEALQIVTGELNPSATVPDEKRAEFYAEFARCLSKLLDSPEF
jgi:hypothetical protein